MSRKTLRILGPGLLVAATGVGAGDLATAAFTGNRLGTAVLWVVVLGAFLKFVLNEGLTRWQLATGRTLLEGVVDHLGRPAAWLFLVYFVAWSYMVAAALMSACGVVAHAMVPVFAQADSGKIAFGLVHSALGLALVRLGGYRLFETVMKACIGVMFATVLVTAGLLRPDAGAILEGLFVPRIPDLAGEGLGWTIALMGGVGGTVTVLCYGYWIREEGRLGPQDLTVCRLDLAIGYAMTALFGLAMVVIGSTIQVEGGGATLVVKLAERLEGQVGPVGRWLFLAGAWGAVFSSVLGVWQAIPYLFVDLTGLLRRGPGATSAIDTASRAYRGCLYALAVVPATGLWIGFARMQKAYAIVGALFLPLLALALLLLNGRAAWVGRQHCNRPLTAVLLVLVLAFFAWAGWQSRGSGGA